MKKKESKEVQGRVGCLSKKENNGVRVRARAKVDNYVMYYVCMNEALKEGRKEADGE